MMSPEFHDESPHEGVDYLELRSYYKYCSGQDEILKGIFEDHKIRFTQPAALNDPLEFNPIIKFNNDVENYRRFKCKGEFFPSEEERLRSRIVESQVNAFGILSLTKVPDCFDMWSRYADGHKGFLMQFKPDFNKHPCMISKKGECYPVHEVTYVDEYTVNIDDLVNDQGWASYTTINEKMFFTKTSRWRFEEEYRMVRSLADHKNWHWLDNRRHRDLNIYLFNFSLDCIESVTFGACMPVENKKKIMAACEGTGIKFLQECLIRDQKDRFGHLGRVMRIQADLFPDFLEMSEFTMEEKYIEEREKPPIVLSSFEDIPYYASDREWVDQYYTNRIDRKAKGKTRDSH